MTREIGVGMVGFGFIGKVHTHAHRALPLFYDPLCLSPRLVGVCTSRPESADKARLQGGFAEAFTDPQALLARDDIALVHCCTPNAAHKDFLLAALDAGKHIYCDKPLALNVTEAQEISEKAHLSGRVCRMTFNYRFLPATLRAKELIESGALGEIYHFRGAYLHAGYIDPKRPRTWRTDFSQSGGGAIMDLGVHLIDLLRWLLGEFAEVSATLETRIPTRPHVATGAPTTVDVDDIALAQVRLANGAYGMIEASRLATGVQDELRFEIHGSRGALSFNLMDPHWLTFYDATIPERPLGGERGPQRIECVNRYPKPYALAVTKNPYGWLQAHIHCLHDCLQAIATNDTQSGPNFEDGLAAQKVVAACQRSSVERAWVTV